MIRCIFAVDQGLGYSNKGSLPDWKSKADFRHFKESTVGQIVVMGSKTWEDPMMCRPLPNRINCVVTSRDDLIDNDKIDHYVRGHEELEVVIPKLKTLYPDKDIVILGGWNIISQCINIIEKLQLTIMHEHYETDTSVPWNWLVGFEHGETFELSDGKGRVVEFNK
jgi:dihydrofolate reductase